MNGPTPIMFVMLSAVAPSNPKRRWSRAGIPDQGAVDAAPVVAADAVVSGRSV